MELGEGVQVGHDPLNVRELSHVDAKTFSIEYLSRQESVGKGEDVTQTVLALCLLDGVLKGGQTSRNGPLSPRLLVVIAKARSDLLEDGQVLDGLRASVDDLTKSADLGLFKRIFGK